MVTKQKSTKAAKATKTTAVKKSVVAAKVKKTVKKKLDYLYAVGRRKTSVARVRRVPGGIGTITVNQKPLEDYFQETELQSIVKEPITLLGSDDRVEYTVRVVGGGKHSQAEAVRHGIARVLLIVNPDHRLTLKQAGWLTRDARIKERKKPGLKRARRAPQWAKR